jgi:hypothetical protein
MSYKPLDGPPRLVTGIDLPFYTLYRVSQEEMSIFWEVTESVILSKKVYIYIYTHGPIPKCFRDRAISLHSSKIVDKKDILHTVSKSGIY